MKISLCIICFCLLTIVALKFPFFICLAHPAMANVGVHVISSQGDMFAFQKAELITNLEYCSCEPELK